MRILSIFPVAAVLALVVTVNAVAESGQQVDPVRVIDLGLSLERSVKAPVISDLALGTSGKCWATCGDDHLVRIWDTAKGAVSQKLAGHLDWVRTVVFSSDGKTLVTAGDDRQVRFWDTETGKLKYAVPTSGQTVNRLAFSPSNRSLAVVGSGRDVWLIDTQERRIRQTLEAPSTDNRTVAFSPDGSMLAVAGRSGTIRIWRINNEGRPYDVTGHTRRIRALTFSCDSGILASAGDDRQVKMWDTKTWLEKSALPKRPGRILSIVFCGPNCDCLAVGSSDNVIRVWDVRRPQQIYELIGHTGSISTLAWNQETNTLLSGSFDTTIRLWKIENELPPVPQAEPKSEIASLPGK